MAAALVEKYLRRLLMMLSSDRRETDDVVPLRPLRATMPRRNISIALTIICANGSIRPCLPKRGLRASHDEAFRCTCRPPHHIDEAS